MVTESLSQLITYYKYVFLGYPSLNYNTLNTSYAGIWLGYKHGAPFYSMNYKGVVERPNIGRTLWCNYNAFTLLFDSVGQFVGKDKVLILSPHKQSVDRIIEGRFLVAKEESYTRKLHFWLDTLNIDFHVYDSREYPYSTLVEYARGEVLKLRQQVVKGGVESFDGL